nr:MAG TPA: C2H2 type zinc-finger protein [Caudoviricetes sp.]
MYKPKIIEKKCEYCGATFKTTSSRIKCCSSECKRLRKNKMLREFLKKRKEIIEQRKLKIRRGNDFICKFRDISQKTGLSYGIVKAYYPNMVYIQKMAEYKLYARTGRKSDFTWLKAINTQTESVFTMYIN